MIKKYHIENTRFLMDFIKSDIFQNVYLYIDASTYGFENHDVMTWITFDEAGATGIIYQYYGSFQLFQMRELSNQNIDAICRLMEENQIEMVSGNVDIIKRIWEKTSGFRMTEGVIMRAGEKAAQKDNQVEWAQMSDCKEIAELICADEGIGGHYTVPLLQEQLEDRMENWNCKNLILRKEGKIVSHMATYADVEGIAVLGGLVTAPAYRGHGFGRIILQGITDALKQEGKIPVLYCYETEVIAWYEHIGWEKVTTCAKLERIH